jgi:serine/threonine protein kinase
MDKYSDEFGVGSVRYLAPECLGFYESGKADDRDCYFTPAADIWALGVLLLNMIFGRNPWHEASFSDAVFNSYINVDTAILKRNLKISDNLDHFLRHKVFNMDPDKRCDVMEFAEFVAAQKQFLDTDADDDSSIQVEFVSGGDKVNIIHKLVNNSESNGSGSQIFNKPSRISIPENDNNESFASNLNASIIGHIGSIDGFGTLKMSNADISSPYIESKENRIQLAKKIGFSSVSSMDRIASQRIKKKMDRNSGRKTKLV